MRENRHKVCVIHHHFPAFRAAGGKAGEEVIKKSFRIILPVRVSSNCVGFASECICEERTQGERGEGKIGAGCLIW